MCGRYVSASSPSEIADYFGATSVAESLIEPESAPEPNYNVAPTTDVPVLVGHDPRDTVGHDRSQSAGAIRHLDTFRWGLVPSWAKSRSIGAKMINARSETATAKPAFRAAIKRRRCIIPADAFYEWTKAANPDGPKPLKQPWCIMDRDGDPFAFAGLWETWRDPEADDPEAPIFSCTVLTRAANEAMSAIHDRMPVMVRPHRWDDWIDPANADGGSLLESIEPVPSELLAIYAVSTAVNNSRSRGVELLDEVEPLAPLPVITGSES